LVRLARRVDKQKTHRRKPTVGLVKSGYDYENHLPPSAERAIATGQSQAACLGNGFDLVMVEFIKTGAL